MTEKPTYAELQERVQNLENRIFAKGRFQNISRTLFKISSAVNTTQNLDALYKSIHDGLSSVIDTTNFFVAIYDKAQDSIDFPYCVDSVDEYYPPVIEISKTESLTAEVIRTGLPLVITKDEMLNQRQKSFKKVPDCTPSEIWLGVPLKIETGIIGVIAVQSYDDAGCYDQTDLDVMVSVADQVAIAIDRKSSEETLRESEVKYNNFVSNIPGTIYQLIMSSDGQFHFVYLSDNCLDLFGYRAEEIKKDAQLIFDNIPTPEVDQLIREIERSASTLTRYRFEHRFIKKDGEEIWIYTSSIPRKLADGAIIWDGIGLDITEQKQAENEKEIQRKILFEAEKLADVGGWEWDVVKNKGTMSENWLRIHGCTHKHLSISELLVLAHVDDREKIQDTFKRAVEGGAPYEIEHRIIRQDTGEERYIKAYGTIKTDQAGKPVKLYGAAHDITHIKNIQKKLEESQKILEARVKERTTELQQKTVSLEKSNIALKVLIEQRLVDKENLEKEMLFNIKKLLIPCLGKAQELSSNVEQKTYLEIIENNLNEIISPFAPKFGNDLSKLSQGELEVVDLIKHGKSNKEIAALLNLSPSTITTYRQRIRKKLGLINSKINLRSMLTSE